MGMGMLGVGVLLTVPWFTIDLLLDRNCNNAQAGHSRRNVPPLPAANGEVCGVPFSMSATKISK